MLSQSQPCLPLWSAHSRLAAAKLAQKLESEKLQVLVTNNAKTLPGVVIDAQPVTARLAVGVFPVQVAEGRQPVVKHSLLQPPHHRLIAPNPVACSARCPAA